LLDGSTLEMLDEDLEGNIICENSFTDTWLGGTVVSDVRIDDSKKMTRITRELSALDVARIWKTVLAESLGINKRCSKEVAECFTFRLLGETFLTSLEHIVAEEHEHKEEGIENEDLAGIDRRSAEKNRLGVRITDLVGLEHGLNHDERVDDVLTKKSASVEHGLIRTAVEHTKEVATTKVIHELWEQDELLAQGQARWVVLTVVSKLADETDEGTIDPTEYIVGIFVVQLGDGVTSKKDSGSLLIE